MAAWIAIIVYYSFYSVCLIAKVMGTRKEHIETGERVDLHDSGRMRAASLGA